MERKIIYGENYARNLDNVKEKLEQYYPNTYDKFFENLNYKIEFLKYFPEMYQIYDKNKRRVVLLNNYMLIYEIKGNIVIISRILNSKTSQNNKIS